MRDPGTETAAGASRGLSSGLGERSGNIETLARGLSVFIQIVHDCYFDFKDCYFDFKDYQTRVDRVKPGI